MGGSWLYSQYIAGVGYVVDWEAARAAANNQALNGFLDQLQAVAYILGVSVNDLWAANNLDDPTDPNKLHPFLEGGNWNFLIPGRMPSCPNDRCGDLPSLHSESPYVHLDTANPFSWFGIGAIVHLGADVILGNTIWASGIPRR